MDQNKETRKLALHVPARIKPDYNYGSQRFEYSFVTIDDNGVVRNCSDSDDFSADLDGLILYSQASPRINDNKPFAFTTEYRNLYFLDLGRAERCVKMLRKISKAADKFPVQPETFGQYVAMMLTALGVTMIVKDQAADSGRESGWHDETQHTTWKLKECQWLIDRQIADFIAEHSERMASCAA